jgi:hypothetical protein
MTTPKRTTIARVMLLAAAAASGYYRPVDAFAPSSPLIVVRSPSSANKLAAAGGVGGNDIVVEGRKRDHRRVVGVGVANPDNAATAISTVLLAATLLLSPLPSYADGQTKEFKLPPIDYSDKVRRDHHVYTG